MYNVSREYSLCSLFRMDSEFCYTIGYTYSNDTVVNQLIQLIVQDNNIPQNEVKTFITPDEADDFLA